MNLVWSRIRLAIWKILLLVTMVFWLACTQEMEHEYSRKMAFIKVEQINTIVPLRAALNNPGEWCVVSVGDKALHFVNAVGRQVQVPFTASMRYAPPHCIAGFVVGIPTLPNTNGFFESRVYDAVCPSCYESESATIKQLTLNDTLLGQAHCPRCWRRYDLHTGGVVYQGRQDTQANIRLYRYRQHYQAHQQLWLVQN